MAPFDIIYDMSVVIDTNIIVAGLMSNLGLSFRILSLIPTDRLRFIISVPLFLEYESVLKRDHLLQQFNLSIDDIDTILNMIALKSIKVKIFYLWRPFLKDPGDDLVLETAVSGKAESIITFNTKDFKNVQNTFGIKILTPKQYFTSLEQGD